MKIGRKLFRNTPIQRLGITTFIYKKIALRAFGSEPVEVEFRNIKILYPGGDYTTLPTLVSGEYEKMELDHLKKTLDGLDGQITAFDIGANVGIWTVLLASHPKVSKVVSFEPSPSNLSFLRHNISINGVEDKVEIVEAAVSDAPGTAFFNNEGSGATMRLSDSGKFSVSTVTLDDIGNNLQIGLIKIDVEGFEPAVLDGAWQTIERCLPHLYIEYSISQATMAGKSWGRAGLKLLNLYKEMTIISDGGLSPAHTFDMLEDDHRLLNLYFGPR